MGALPHNLRFLGAFPHNSKILGPHNSKILGPHNSKILGCRDSKILGCRDSKILGPHNSKILGCRDLRINLIRSSDKIIMARRKRTYEFMMAEVRALQRVSSRMAAIHELKEEVNLTKLLVMFTGTDFEKFCNLLRWIEFPHIVREFSQHPLYPGNVNGVHLIILSHYLDGLQINFEMIFNPVSGLHLRNNVSYTEDV